MLKLEGLAVGRRHVRTLLRRMGLEAIYRKRRTSLPEQGHTLYPYLLSGAASSCRTKCGRAEVTYLPMARGFLYLVEILDLASRKVLAWRPSNTLATDSCVEALQEALNRFGSPEIFNTDQGAQFAASAFSAVLQAQGIRISMDGKGRWIDNVFVERLWRSVKYEAVYLHAYESPREANGALERYFEFYNGRRPHQALDGRTPEGAYSAINEVRQAA
jgi:putative transposase